MLYIVPTPIGNLSDMTQRAIDTLQEVSLILAEDTRNTGKLLKKYNISTPMKAYHEHNEHHILPKIVEALKAGKDIGLVSDAGTPGISDPGFLLSRACHENDIAISCLPGPTALIPALVASGLPCHKFYFEGFLPHKKGRKTRLEYISQLEDTVILYESPHRLVKCLQQLEEHCGSDRKVCVCREISKLHETITLDSIGAQIKYFQNLSVKGEIVLVLEGK